MASKPLAELSPAYRRRIERGIAAGRSRQEARGKRAGEHIIRKEREAARAPEYAAIGLLPPNQREIVRRFAREQARRNGLNGRQVGDAMIAWTMKVGFDKFLALRSAQREMVAQYREELRDGIYVPRSEDFLEDIAEDLDDLYPPDLFWMYYK